MQKRLFLSSTTSIFPLASLAVMSVALGAQTPASPPAPDPSMTPGTTQTGSQPRAATDAGTPQQSQQAAQIQATSLAAELTKGIDTKKAKAGDEVNAKTITDAKLPDGTMLPKGTKLMGNVVEVTSKSKEQKNSHLVISLNHAVTKDGHDMPIRAAVTSMAAPVMPQSMDAPSPAGGGMAAPSGGGGGADSSGSSASTPAPSSSMPTMSSSTPSDPQSQQGTTLKSAQDRVPVGNMPHVVLSAPTTPQSAGVLDAENQNISLQSGTKFTANVTPAQGGQ